jgi:hypothetical protein
MAIKSPFTVGFLLPILEKMTIHFRANPASGEVVEWSIAPVLKTGEPQGSVGSNPTLSAIFRFLRKLRMPFVARRAK